MSEQAPAHKRRRYDLTATFDVLVGKEPNQQRFTVYHDLLTRRSEFFHAARSARWTDSVKPTTLEDHEPEVFSAYLHCLHFGADGLAMDFAPDMPGKSGESATGAELSTDTAAYGAFKMNLLVNLYLLADKLIDPTTANLTIDELIALVDRQQVFLSPDTIKEVYTHTTDGCPLRAYIRDFFVHDAGAAINEMLQKNDLPHELLRAVVLEMRTKNSNRRKKTIKQVYGVKAIDRPKGHYHQKIQTVAPSKKFAAVKAAHPETSRKVAKYKAGYESTSDSSSEGTSEDSSD